MFYLYHVTLEWVTDQLPETKITDPEPSTSSTKTASKHDLSGRLSMGMRKYILEKIVDTGKKKKPQTQCIVCAAKKVRSEISDICTQVLLCTSSSKK